MKTPKTARICGRRPFLFSKSHIGCPRGGWVCFLDVSQIQHWLRFLELFVLGLPSVALFELLLVSASFLFLYCTAEISSTCRCTSSRLETPSTAVLRGDLLASTLQSLVPQQPRQFTTLPKAPGCGRVVHPFTSASDTKEKTKNNTARRFPLSLALSLSLCTTTRSKMRLCGMIFATSTICSWI